MCLCLCSTKLNTRNSVLYKCLSEISSLKAEGVAGGWKKLNIGQLHDWYWWVNVGGRWIERQWDRWVKGYELDKLKIHKQFHLELVWETGTSIFWGLGLYKMLTESFMNWTQKVKIPVAYRSVNYKFFIRNSRSVNGTNISVRVTLL